MNDKIIELAKEAGIHPTNFEHDADLSGPLKKFAELIVKECAGITLDYKNDDYYNGWCDHSAEILEHFGVK